MNYLAHLFLSGDDEELLIGNFIGDSVKGNDVDDFREGVKGGILLHRSIDSYTDAATQVVGLVVGAFFAWGQERAHGVVRSPQQLQRAMEAPVLGVLDEKAIVDPRWSEPPARADRPADSSAGLLLTTALALGLVILAAFVYLMTLWAVGALDRTPERTWPAAQEQEIRQALPSLERSDAPPAPPESDAPEPAAPAAPPDAKP